MTNHKFDLTVSEVFADTETRTIRGLAIPIKETAFNAGRQWQFASGSVEFGANTPLLQYHDRDRPVGKLTNHEWTDDGLRVTFKVSKTLAGDEALQLAADGVLGLSVGITTVLDGKDSDGIYQVSKANAGEVSLTPLPAFNSARVESVAFSQEEAATVADNDNTATPDVASTLLAKLTQSMITLSEQQKNVGPTAVPVASTFVSEPPPYRFDGHRGAHGFVSDMRAAHEFHDADAATRLDKFLEATFVSSANVASLNPTVNKPDMYVPSLRYADRPLANAISTASIPDATPFTFPKFNSSGNLVAVHSEGVEPSAATFTATSQTVTPGALSGRAVLPREVWDAGGNPAVDALVWSEMLNAAVEAAETRVATMLDAMTPTGQIPVVGVNDSAVDDLVGALIALQYEKGGHRFNSIVASQPLYTALASAKDSTGRRLLAQISPVSADGTAARGWASLSVGAASVVPAWGLATSSYLFPKASVWQWLSPPQKLTFDVSVAVITIGLFMYAAEAVTRNADIREITYTAS